MARWWFLRVLSNSSKPQTWHEIQPQGRLAWTPWHAGGFCVYCQTPPPSHGSCGQSPGEPGQAQAGHAEPCSPPAQEQPQPPQGQPGALPSQPPSDGAACRAHGWIGHHHPAGQASP